MSHRVTHLRFQPYGFHSNLLPFDVLDYITDYIDKRSDLLSFALCCKKIQEIVVPHIQYCHIRCDPFREAFFAKIADSPGILRRIRYLELFDESAGVVWYESDDEEDLPLPDTEFFSGSSKAILPSKTIQTLGLCRFFPY
ncbi:hypothetical protein M422DRAFT_268607 [Sphaerobolus stellatus SS14]|uniref:Unplaced genomic scaffold SPHSTscaffold_197, whole genome shotgun sequence n=1 Tax=Sphaerobolus stellatus (strain SS14) TaxID=990650 RepID=A0A0C9UXY0_SPHS4|nr:hypothetical protein M422DRAFT_270131 [Sphaerobolus stellatus SS14]KIJ29935.1 hypothetical protein M422DRAFT_268607 [Sphaerobolus stellatus SS14]